MKHTELEAGKHYRAMSPKGHEILGTYEMCPARAEIAYFFKPEPANPAGYEHEGGSEFFYDAMETMTRGEGNVIFLCTEGSEWTIDQLTFEELPE